MSFYDDTDYSDSDRKELRSVIPITSDELADITRMMDAVKSSKNATPDPVMMYDGNGDILGMIAWNGDIGEVVFTPGD